MPSVRRQIRRCQANHWSFVTVGLAAHKRRVLARLNAHTNLGTTSNYMMAVNEYMQAAVRKLDVTRGRPPGAVLLESPEIVTEESGVAT
jgi:hypothetical protein